MPRRVGKGFESKKKYLKRYERSFVRSGTRTGVPKREARRNWKQGARKSWRSKGHYTPAFKSRYRRRQYSPYRRPPPLTGFQDPPHNRTGGTVNILDNLPVATLTFLSGIVLIVIGYVDDKLTLEQAFESLVFLGGGSAGIGYVRNQAGKGIRKSQD